MFGTFPVGRLFGIPILCSWSFVLLLVLVLSTQGLEGAILICALLPALLLHEVGHGLVAKRYGIHVHDITMWFLGGMARMSSIPEHPRIESYVALAGPLTNLALVPLGWLLTLPALVLVPGASPPALVDLAGGLAHFGLIFVLVNLALGLFNLLPAFPMDGGRILRALLARGRDWVSATELAVTVGRAVAGGAVLVAFSASLMGRNSPVLAILLVAAFVWIMGGRELLSVRLRHGFSPFGGQARDAGPVEPPSAQWSAPPPSNGTATEAVDAHPPVGARAARRPALWETGEPKGPGERGFSQREVEALERYRGRLRGSDSDE